MADACAQLYADDEGIGMLAWLHSLSFGQAQSVEARTIVQILLVPLLQARHLVSC